MSKYDESEAARMSAISRTVLIGACEVHRADPPPNKCPWCRIAELESQRDALQACADHLLNAARMVEGLGGVGSSLLRAAIAEVEEPES